MVSKGNADKFHYTLNSFGGGLIVDVDIWSDANDVGKHDELIYYADQY